MSSLGLLRTRAVCATTPHRRQLGGPSWEPRWAVTAEACVGCARPGSFTGPRGARTHELAPLILSRAQVAGLVERMLKSSRRRVDISQPFGQVSPGAPDPGASGRP